MLFPLRIVPAKESAIQKMLRPFQSLPLLKSNPPRKISMILGPFCQRMRRILRTIPSSPETEVLSPFPFPVDIFFPSRWSRPTPRRHLETSLFFSFPARPRRRIPLFQSDARLFKGFFLLYPELFVESSCAPSLFPAVALFFPPSPFPARLSCMNCCWPLRRRSPSLTRLSDRAWFFPFAEFRSRSPPLKTFLPPHRKC